MALVKSTLKADIFKGLYMIFADRAAKATSGDEQEDPERVISQMADDMANVISDAVDAYIKSGDISISQKNIMVVSPTGSCTVTPVAPAKIK